MNPNFDARRKTALALGLLVALAVAPFLGSLRGEFVYDDRIQILENPLIQQPELLGKALTQDVWSFKGERETAWSNYYRPAFALWLAANWQLFGAHPTGWHVGNLALHAGVVGLAFALLLRLGCALPGAFLVAALFAVHPVHVESVAWISGSPDLLMSIGILGALALEAPAPGRLRGARRLLALALAAVALGSKETALLLPLLVAALAWARQPELSRGRRTRAALTAMLPYAALSAAFLIARLAVIGGFATPTPWTLRGIDLALSLPGVVAFYLRQAFLPFWIGPTYPVRMVTPEVAGAANFVLPLLVTLAVVGLLWAASRRSPLRPFCFALALVPLAPALHLGAFMQEQLVHDRYLYLPVLGWLALAGLGLQAACRALLPGPALSSRRVAAGGLGLALVALCVTKSLSLVPDYRDERSFFRAAVASDPSSSFHWAQLAATELRLGQFAAAAASAERALALQPVTAALLVRADLAARDRRFAAAEGDLEAILQRFPDQTAAIERLAIVYASQGKNARAIGLLRRSRSIAPWRHCSLTGNLAVVLYLDGQKNEAIRELEGLREGEASDPTPACGLALYRLGSLYLELDRPGDAVRAFEAYLLASDGAVAAFHDEPRAAVRRSLAELRRSRAPAP